MNESKALGHDAIRQLSRLSPGRFYRSLAIDWVILILTMASASMSAHPALLLFCMLVVGNRQQALAVLGHECVHYNVHRSKALNDLVGNLCCFWPLGVTLEGFRRFHLSHHQHIGEDGDPELELYTPSSWKLPAKEYAFPRWFVADLLGFGLPDFLRLVKLIQPTPVALTIAPIIFWAVWAAVFWSFGKPWLILIWGLPLPTVFWASLRFRTWTEHRGVKGTHRFFASRLFLDLFFPHNIWLHHEHHEWPSIPFYNLPNARELNKSQPIVPLMQVVDFLETGDPTYARISGLQLEPSDFHACVREAIDQRAK